MWLKRLIILSSNRNFGCPLRQRFYWRTQHLNVHNYCNILDESDRYIEINVEAKDVEQLIAHLGDEIPVLFIYTTPGCAQRIRSQLKMKADQGYYFDPGSKGKGHFSCKILGLQIILLN